MALALPRPVVVPIAQPFDDVGPISGEVLLFANIVGEVGEEQRKPLRFLVAAGNAPRHASCAVPRVAIADRGIGILRSFQESASPFWKSELTDADAITLALQVKVSSKSHLITAWGLSPNAGVGLTLLKELCVKTGGQFFMASGNGVCSLPAGGGALQQDVLPTRFQGTVCVLAFKRARVKNFVELLHRAKQATGLLPSGEDLGKFFV